MIFSIGNLVTLLIVLLILLIFRQVDKNNRSLEKVKKYSDRVIKNLSGYVDEKTTEIKDLSIELQVNLKTAREILKKVQSVKEELKERTGEVATIGKKLAEYDNALKELVQMTDRVDENMRRLHGESQFVDAVFGKIKSINSQLSKIEKDIPALETRITTANKIELEKVRKGVLEGTELKVREMAGLVDEAEKRVKDFSVYLTHLEERREALEKETYDKIKGIFESFEVKARGERSRLMQEFVASVKKILSEVEEKGKAFTKKLENFVNNSEQRYSGLLERFREELGSIDKNYELQIEKKRNEYLEVIKKGENLDDEIFSSIKERIERNEEEAKARLDSMRKKLEETLTFIDGRLGEYEEEVRYRISKLEESNVDIEELEKNLRAAMDKVSVKVEGDFDTFVKYLEQRRVEEKSRAEEELRGIKENIESIDRELAELKAKAYQDVSEKLDVFEDEFFNDLKTKTKNMEEKIRSWQGDVESKMVEIETEYTTSRENLEKKYEKELKEKLISLKASIDSDISRIENNIGEFEKQLKERITGSENLLESLGDDLKGKLEQTRAEVLQIFDSAVSSLKETLSGNIGRVERETDLRLNELMSDLDSRRKAIEAMVEASRADVSNWQAEIVEELKESKVTIDDRIADLKDQVDNVLREIRDDFASQRDDLIVSTNEERMNLKNELKDIEGSIIELQNNLEMRSESALTELKQNLESFDIDFRKHLLNFQNDVEGRMKEFKSMIDETKERAEAMQKKLFGRVEEGYKQLQGNLTDVDRRLKDFISQTKLFDRADTLKEALSNDIESMKSEIDKLKDWKSEIDRIETELSKTRKLGEDVSAKLTKFFSEKRRIDSMEGDFKKLLNISKDIDIKLENVTASHDVLQEIQARIRSLEDLEKIVETRYERLEKKKEIIESTIDGIDKNFESLSQLEKSLKTMSAGLEDFTVKLEDVRREISVLSTNKERADEAVELITEIESTISELEERMEKLQKAREWLARTETRLENIGRQAEEQVKLLENLIRAESDGSGDDRGAPPVDKREMVIKLAHQGWSSKDIAKATKLSRGEVELILEIAPKT